jgi:O-antigen ligase
LLAITVRSETFQLAERVRLLPLALVVAVVAYVALTGAGTAGIVLVASSVALAVVLGLVLRSTEPAIRGEMVRPVATGALLVTPALATLYLAFSSGGFYADSVALIALVALVLFAVRCALAREPLRGLSPAAFVPAAALAALAAWTLVSATWSNSPGRALLEADRILLYLVVLLLFASLGRSSERLGFAVRALAVVFALVAVAAFVSRTAPDVLSTPEGFASNRLSYPLTYWNALGVFCAIGMVLCLHLTASIGEPRTVRVLAAGALPVLAATLLLTFSRGGMGAAVLGLVLYAVVGHPRALITALLAAAPPTALAVMSAYDATLLVSEDPTSPAAVAEGHDLAELVVWCVIAALALRAVLLLADARLARVQLGRSATRAGWTGALVAAVVLALALDAPGVVSDRVDQFVNQSNVGRTEQTRERLTSASNQGRLVLWEAAIDGYRADRLKGSGAGTYVALWNRYGNRSQSVVDAHSVYVETLAELGLVGFALLVVALVALLAGVLPLRRGPDRCVYAAILAALVAWAAHAGLDWDWEMPAVTLPLFALAGLALARPGDAPARRGPGGPALAVIGLVALAVAILPGTVLASQQRLDASVEALREGDCTAALAEARRAVDVLSARPEAHELIGICLARGGDYGGAAAALERALERDPDNWGLHASLAAVLAADGRDPRAEARAALTRNPREPLARQLAERLGGSKSGRWRRVGRELARDLAPSGRW